MKSLLSKSLLAAGLAFASIASPSVADVFRTSNSSDDSDKGFYGVFSAGFENFREVDYQTTISGNKHGGESYLGGDTVYEFGFGYDFGSVRTELTYKTQGYSFDGCIQTERGDTSCKNDTLGGSADGIKAYMASAYWDIPWQPQLFNAKFTPYIGGGIGTTIIEPDNITVDGTEYSLDNENTFTYQIKAGVSYELAEQFDLLGEATYRKYSDIKSGTEVANVDFNIDDISSWSFLFGARIRF